MPILLKKSISLPSKQDSTETLSSVTQTSLDRHQDHVQDHPNCHLSWPPQELYLNGQCTIHIQGFGGRNGKKRGENWLTKWVGWAEHREKCLHRKIGKCNR